MDRPRQGAWFLQTDPIGSKDDLDLYAYTAGDPVNKADPTGNDAGDIFRSERAAVMDFANLYHDETLERGLEFGTVLYKDSNGNYSYTQPMLGRETQTGFGSAPAGTDMTAVAHTHPANTKQDLQNGADTADHPSDNDRFIASTRNRTMYTVGAKGTVTKTVPKGEPDRFTGMRPVQDSTVGHVRTSPETKQKVCTKNKDAEICT